MAGGAVVTVPAVQEEGSCQTEDKGYYNVMLIGTTGQGKSTTADKLLIANPSQHPYHNDGGVPPGEPVLNEENRQLKMDDITMWLLHASKDPPTDASGKVIDQDNLQIAQTRVKCLVYFRNKPDPHKQVNNARGSGMNIFSSTKDCQVLSNETSKVRVMDVPGFFDGASIILNEENKSAIADSLVLQGENNLVLNNLDITRRIVRIQTTLGMKFHRILYFLPSRGALERVTAHLKLEVGFMMHYFGKSIFQCLVLVATVPDYISEIEEFPESKKFPEKAKKSTLGIFREVLKEVFSSTEEETIPNPPLIFISMTDSCEKILDKVKRAYDADVSLNLRFNPSTCTNCGVKIGMVRGKKVTCHFNTNTISYEESTCHPKLVAKYSRADKAWGEFKHVMLFRWVKNPWPVFTEEECAGCKGSSNSRGCMKVGSEFEFKVKKHVEKITVDHTNKFDDEEAVVIEGENGTKNPPANEQFEVEAENQAVNTGAQNEVEESTGITNSAAVNQPPTMERNVDAGGGLEANVAHLSIQSQHEPMQEYPVESQNPCYDSKGT